MPLRRPRSRALARRAKQGAGEASGTSDVKTYWFARSLPGPPVKLEVVKDGKTVLTYTMQANRTH